MSQPWWGKESGAVDATIIPGELGQRPQLHPQRSSVLTEELRGRQPDYTPDWNEPGRGDAGGVLVELFGGQAETTFNRLNLLPDKALIEFLQVAGVEPETSRPASAMVQFEVAPAAESSVLIPKGFQLSAQSANDSPDLVIFETLDNTTVTSASISQIQVDRCAGERDVTAENKDPSVAFAPLGDRPELGDALVIGLSGAESISDSISLGIQIAAVPGDPPPATSGGVAPLPVPIAPVLRWEARVGSSFVPMDVLTDETSSLWRSGIVRLRVPARWQPTRLRFSEELHYWLRLRLVHGAFNRPPQLSTIRINVARTLAVRTIRNETLQPLDGPNSSRFQLQNRPVVRKSLDLAVDATPFDQPDRANELRGWKEVDDLSQYGPEDRVYLLDPAMGIVTFGDAAVPPGFRNVRTLSYQVSSGAEGAVDAEQISSMINTARFVTGVTNPLRASGGVNGESSVAASRRGPATIRSGRRAVTVSDYALWARFAPGTRLPKPTRSQDVTLSFPRRIPSVVGVFVVPKAEAGIPPVPDEAALRTVAEFLSSEVAQAGVEVVTAAPRYRYVRTELGFMAEESASIADVIQDLINELDRYLNPLVGGNQGQGWDFGGTLFFLSLDATTA